VVTARIDRGVFIIEVKFGEEIGEPQVGMVKSLDRPNILLVTIKEVSKHPFCVNTLRDDVLPKIDNSSLPINL
jgi:hypothetical protein